MSYVSVESVVPFDVSTVFAFVCEPSRYGSLFPEGFEFGLVSPALKMNRGAEYEFKLSRFGVQQILGLRVEEFKPNEEIKFVQSVGFFSYYTHVIQFRSHDSNATLLSQFVEYDLRFGLIGKLYDDLYMRRYLEKLLKIFNKSVETKLKTGKR